MSEKNSSILANMISGFSKEELSCYSGIMSNIEFYPKGIFIDKSNWNDRAKRVLSGCSDAVLEALNFVQLHPDALVEYDDSRIGSIDIFE